MPLPGLHDRLDQRLRLRTGQPHRAGTAADARTAVGWSYTLLTGDEQLLRGAPLERLIHLVSH